MSGPLKIFISYAHEDSKQKEELEHHLKVWERLHFSVIWHDRQIPAGNEREQEIDKNLDDSDIILLLITANFIASDYCYCIEMQRAMERHATGQACVIPLILREVVWEQTPFGGLQALPQNGKPVDSDHWHSPDEAFVDIARGIHKVVCELRVDLRAKPTSSDQLYESLLRLDFKQQGGVFNQFLQKGHRTGAFVISGECGHGQDWLLNRFLYRLSKRLAEPSSRKQIGKVCKLDFASRMRKRDIETLWRELAVEIGLKNAWKMSLPKALIESVYALLKTQTVVFILRNPVHMEDRYVKQFFQDFWSPLTTKYEDDGFSPSHYCLLFLVDNDDCMDRWVSIGAGPFDSSWKPSVPIKLNRLAKFQEPLLTDWIDYESEAWAMTPEAQDLLTSSDGVPEQVLDQVCTFFDHDWYEREKVWLKY